MKHLHYTVYMICSTAMFMILNYDAISILTLILLFIMFEYLYYLCILKVSSETWQHTKCLKCNRMTPQHWIHCEVCNRCVNVTYNHYDIISGCALKQNYWRYISLLRGVICVNIILAIVGLVLYPYIIIFTLTHLYVLKSTYNTNQENIYVN